MSECQTTVSEFHHEQLVAYLKFAGAKRSEALRDVEVCFKEVAQSRLSDDSAVFTTDEVASMLDGVKTGVKGDVQTELLHSAHTTALVLSQLFAQAEEIMLDLHVDVAQLENESLLREMASRDPSAPQGQTKLKPMSQAASSSVVKHAMEKRGRAEDRFAQLQRQCTEILRAKTALAEELDAIKRSGAPVACVVPAVAVPAVAVAPSSEVAEMREEVERARREVAEMRQRAAKAESDLQKKVQATAPFLNLRKMLKQKNDSVRALRELLRKNAPNVQIPGESGDGEDMAPEDDDARPRISAS